MREHPWTLHILSAMTAGAASTISTNPLWVIKTRFMVRTPSDDPLRSQVRPNTLDATPVRSAVRTYPRCSSHDLPYRRTVCVLSRSASQLIRNHSRRRTVPTLRKAQSDSPYVVHWSFSHMFEIKPPLPKEQGSEEPITSRTILLCSAIAKMTASVATYPHEVVRTRLQTQKRLLANDTANTPRRGLISLTGKLIRKEGWTSLYKGLSVNLLRTVPNSAVTMLT